MLAVPRIAPSLMFFLKNGPALRHDTFHVINYVDRQIIGVLKPELSGALGWSEIDFANFVFAFQLA